MTSPSASLQSRADAARIKRLEGELADTQSRLEGELAETKSRFEGELAETKSRFRRELGSKLDEIERLEAVIQEFIAMKERASEDHDAAQRNPDRPKGSINEKDGEEVKQLRAELAQQENALSRYREANEKFAKMTQEQKEQIRVLEERNRVLEERNPIYRNIQARNRWLQERNQVLQERHRELEGEYSGLLTSISQCNDVIKDEIRQLEKRSRQMPRLPSNVSLIDPSDLGAVEEQGKSNELAERKEAEWKAGVEYEDSQLIGSEPARGEAHALPKRVSRSSAETELLRLKDRQSLNRLGPF